MKKKYTSQDLIKKLRYRYSKGHMSKAFVVIEQVAKGTGAYATGHIDAVVCGLWPSGGLLRSAFEIKVNRGDFLNEMVKPLKNDFAHTHFHEFWYVAPPGIIKSADEVPENCGWMKPHGDTLAVVKQAARKEKPFVDDMYIATLMRAMDKENNRAASDLEKELLEKNSTYLSAKRDSEALHRFFNERREYLTPKDSADDIFKKLEKATAGEKAEKDREHILKCLDAFQKKMIDLSEYFAILAQIGLLERDKLGQLIISDWGGTDAFSIANLRAKKRDMPMYEKVEREKRLKAIGAIFDIIKK